MDKIKFLMSDTSAEITAACREALEQKGVEVTVVEKDGLKVLQKMLAVRPQVVLLDAFMPGLKLQYHSLISGYDQRSAGIPVQTEENDTYLQSHEDNHYRCSDPHSSICLNLFRYDPSS